MQQELSHQKLLDVDDVMTQFYLNFPNFQKLGMLPHHIPQVLFHYTNQNITKEHYQVVLQSLGGRPGFYPPHYSNPLLSPQQ